VAWSPDRGESNNQPTTPRFPGHGTPKIPQIPWLVSQLCCCASLLPTCYPPPITVAPIPHTLTMPPIAGSTGHTTSSPHSASHKRKAMYTNSETRTRSHARDPSQTSMDCGRSTPRKLDVHKDLPGIPSQTTGLRGLEPVMGALPRHKRRPLKVEVSFRLF
jgi:hypothetical protein